MIIRIRTFKNWIELIFFTTEFCPETKSCNQTILLWLTVVKTTWHEGGAPGAPPWKVFKMLNCYVVMTPRISRNIFQVIWEFGSFWSLFCNWKGTISNHSTVHFYVSYEILSVTVSQCTVMSTPPKNISCHVGLMRKFCIDNNFYVL